MRAVVTGAAGFVGRHMCRALADAGYEVMPWDIADGADAHDLFCGHSTTWWSSGADLFVHAAASQPHRAAIDGDPMHLVRNLHLDTAAFGWAVRTGTRMLYLSSCAAYPASLQTPPTTTRHRLAESDIDHRWLQDVVDAYGWTKLTGERMAAAAGLHIPVHVVRPFSGYGEDQDDRFPFGAFAYRARCRDNPFEIWGDGTQIRDWIHISDVVGAALAIVEADFRYPVNLCTGIGTTMREVAGLMCEQAGYKPTFQLHPERSAGAAWRVGDPTLMRRFYTPKVDLAEGIRRALAGNGRMSDA